MRGRKIDMDDLSAHRRHIRRGCIFMSNHLSQT
jgi:hypothetical protein